jgi:hypothetical protein
MIGKHNVSKTDPVSEKLCFQYLEFRTMDKAQKPSNSEHIEEFFTVVRRIRGNLEAEIYGAEVQQTLDLSV